MGGKRKTQHNKEETKVEPVQPVETTGIDLTKIFKAPDQFEQEQSVSQ